MALDGLLLPLTLATLVVVGLVAWWGRRRRPPTLADTAADVGVRDGRRGR